MVGRGEGSASEHADGEGEGAGAIGTRKRPRTRESDHALAAAQTNSIWSKYALRPKFNRWKATLPPPKIIARLQREERLEQSQAEGLSALVAREDEQTMAAFDSFAHINDEDDLLD